MPDCLLAAEHPTAENRSGHLPQGRIGLNLRQILFWTEPSIAWPAVERDPRIGEYLDVLMATLTEVVRDVMSKRPDHRPVLRHEIDLTGGEIIADANFPELLRRRIVGSKFDVTAFFDQHD